MLGAIVGDIVGSVYEWNNIKSKDFPLFRDDCHFTDDTVMTCAVAEGIMNGGSDGCERLPDVILIGGNHHVFHIVISPSMIRMRSRKPAYKRAGRPTDRPAPNGCPERLDFPGFFFVLMGNG